MATAPPYARLLQAPKQSFFLFGMRGVGKSTWARKTFADARRFDLLDERLFQSYLRDSTLFGRELLGISSGQTVVVDEVHRFIESHNLRFVCWGRARGN